MRIPFPWMNNNCESGNHVLKQAVQWKSQNLIDLIETLHSVIQTQYRDLKRSLIPGLGNFRLVHQMRKFSLSAAAWEKKTREQQAAYFQRFLRAPVVEPNHFITSSDNKYVTLPSKERGMKKKNKLSGKETQKHVRKRAKGHTFKKTWKMIKVVF